LIVWYYFKLPLSKRVVPPIGGTPYIPLIKKAFPELCGGNTIFPLIKKKRKRNLKIF